MKTSPSRARALKNYWRLNPNTAGAWISRSKAAKIPLKINEVVTVADLADVLGAPAHVLVADLMDFDVFVSRGSPLEPSCVRRLGSRHGYQINISKAERGRQSMLAPETTMRSTLSGPFVRPGTGD
jgi:hypothetical protein